MRLRETDSLHYAAQVMRRVLTVPDPTRSSSAVRRYDPRTGALREVVPLADWITRYPHRLARVRRHG